jgi:hypothetical protein
VHAQTRSHICRLCGSQLEDPYWIGIRADPILRQLAGHGATDPAIDQAQRIIGASALSRSPARRPRAHSSKSVRGAVARARGALNTWSGGCAPRRSLCRRRASSSGFPASVSVARGLILPGSSSPPPPLCPQLLRLRKCGVGQLALTTLLIEFDEPDRIGVDCNQYIEDIECNVSQASRSYMTPTTYQFLSAPPAAPPGGASPDEVGLLVAENAELVGRMQRLSPVLVGIAQDLSVARRESAALKRENRRLRSRVTTLEQRAAATLRFEPALMGRPDRRTSWRPWQAQPGTTRAPGVVSRSPRPR